MNWVEFERIVAEALKGLPEPLRRRIENVQVVIRDARGSRRQRGARDESDLYGLYEGTPLPERPHDFQGALPDRITLFKNNIEADCEDREEMIRCIQETVIHEFGHYFGFDDEDLGEMGIG
ncbi:MAG: metallopeptidase family protein [Planctomycetes bacterium]|nr:metallopeptidase family protein [Planctomycetota bacterium]